MKCKSYKNLEDTINKFDYLIATTSRFRNKNVKHIVIDDLKKIDLNKKIGFLFGSEASGLSNNEISYANYSLQIPTNVKFKSFDNDELNTQLVQLDSKYGYNYIELNIQLDS